MTADMTALVATIDADSTNDGAKLALADLLQDDGRENEAWALRWHVEHKKWPFLRADLSWGWFKLGMAPVEYVARHAVTAMWIYDALWSDCTILRSWLDAMEYFGKRVRHAKPE